MGNISSIQNLHSFPVNEGKDWLQKMTNPFGVITLDSVYLVVIYPCHRIGLRCHSVM